MTSIRCKNYTKKSKNKIKQTGNHTYSLYGASLLLWYKEYIPPNQYSNRKTGQEQITHQGKTNDKYKTVHPQQKQMQTGLS